MIDRKINKIELINPDYYHLDTCLSIINKSTAMYVKSAFSDSGINKIKSSFSDLIEVDEDEAFSFLACNAHSPDGKNILVEDGAKKLQTTLSSKGFLVHTHDTSEFLKSGGSIFCLKNQGWF